MQTYHQQLRQEAKASKLLDSNTKSTTERTLSDEELWSRLDQLELKELEENEMEER